MLLYELLHPTSYAHALNSYCSGDPHEVLFAVKTGNFWLFGTSIFKKYKLKDIPFAGTAAASMRQGLSTLFIDVMFRFIPFETMTNEVKVGAWTKGASQ